MNGTKTVNIETSSNIDHIELRINNKLKQKITINELRINKKIYILEYKIILEPMLRIFTTFNFKNSSVWQRGDYWKDCLKILKSNFITGKGRKYLEIFIFTSSRLFILCKRMPFIHIRNNDVIWLNWNNKLYIYNLFNNKKWNKKKKRNISNSNWYINNISS